MSSYYEQGLAAMSRCEAARIDPPDYDEDLFDDCDDCDGSGEVHYNPTGSGFMRDPQCDESMTCPKCRGEGVLERDPGEHPRYCGCPECDPDGARDERDER